MVATGNEHRFVVVFEPMEDDLIYAHVPMLPEVQTQGHDMDEAREMVADAVQAAVALRQERNEPIPGEGWARAEDLAVTV
jgi:predicted RNase H-like HicB family nuclease